MKTINVKRVHVEKLSRTMIDVAFIFGVVDSRGMVLIDAGINPYKAKAIYSSMGERITVDTPLKFTLPRGV